jgi:putative ATP-dependent endonuclease of the OLD family
MKLVGLTIENFRSITKAPKLKLSQLTVLVGPNNEGKSNVLRALVTALQILTRGRRRFRTMGPPTPQGLREVFMSVPFYEWERDYPVHLQQQEPDGKSVITLEFSLEKSEVDEFWTEVKSTLNGTLPLTLSLGRNTTAVSVRKKGRGGKALSAKAPLIAAFITRRLNFEYIPAVRTAQQAEAVVEDMLQRELAVIEEDPLYVQALQQIEALQKPILERVASTIRDTLQKFLPAIVDVRVDIASEERSRALRSSIVHVDDGSPTLLQYKGDGVQSLAALGMMRHASESAASGRNLIVAIEEPESHLHPRSMHELHAVLAELAQRHQLVLTTHCPLFVDRSNIRANIIVSGNKARSATDVQEVREILGVRASDNLRSAELVLVVEGEDDRIALIALLAAHSSILKTAIASAALGIDTLAGGSNLPYKLTLIREMLCTYHCFLDDDSAGRTAMEAAQRQGLLTVADVNLCSCPGMIDAEIEDLYDPQVYSQVLQNTYRVSLQHPRFSSNRKWSDRVRDVFKGQGKPWNDQIEAEVKYAVANSVAAAAPNALLPAKREAFNALIAALEQRVTTRT